MISERIESKESKRELLVRAILAAEKSYELSNELAEKIVIFENEKNKAYLAICAEIDYDGKKKYTNEDSRRAAVGIIEDTEKKKDIARISAAIKLNDTIIGLIKSYVQCMEEKT